MLSSLFKRCPSCGIEQSTEGFYIFKKTNRPYPYCKVCVKEKNRLEILQRKERMNRDPAYALLIRNKDSATRKLPHYQAKRRIANLKRLENPEGASWEYAPGVFISCQK